MDYLIANQLFVNLNPVNTNDFGVGQATFMNHQCTIWMAPYDHLVDFNNSHPVEFERMILPETFDVIPTESKFIMTMIVYEEYPSFRTGKEAVNVGIWSLTSLSNTTVTIENASFPI